MKLNVNDVIIVNPWKNFPEERMTCIEVIENENKVFGDLYKFNTGICLYELELQNNFDLWNSRNGYKIVK